MNMTKKIILLVIVIVALILIIKMNKRDQAKQDNNAASAVNITPIEHASMILHWDGVAIYADPVGEVKMFEGKPDADIILLTDIHGDHFDIEALKTIVKEKTIIIAPKAVADEMSDKMPEDTKELREKISVMNNSEVANQFGFKIEAVSMYNLPESDRSYHPKGRGNGYVVEKSDTRVYISGDTSGIPEMRNLQDIDVAFVAMNLPYTMSVSEAADAVLEFKPKKVYPYHYRTPEGFSDVAKFKEIVNSANPEIEVIQLEWYPKF